MGATQMWLELPEGQLFIKEVLSMQEMYEESCAAAVRVGDFNKAMMHQGAIDALSVLLDNMQGLQEGD